MSPGGWTADERVEVYNRPFTPCVRWSIPGYPYGVSLRILIFSSNSKRTKEKKKRSLLPSFSYKKELLSYWIRPDTYLALRSGAEDRPTLCRIASAFHARGREGAQDSRNRLRSCACMAYQIARTIAASRPINRSASAQMSVLRPTRPVDEPHSIA